MYDHYNNKLLHSIWFCALLSYSTWRKSGDTRCIANQRRGATCNTNAWCAHSYGARSLVGSSLVFCSGPHRAEIEVLVGCILMQRSLPSSFQLLVNPFPGGCITKIPLPHFSASCWPGTALAPSLQPSPHMAMSFSTRPQGSTSLMLHLLLRAHRLSQAHRDSLPLTSPRSMLTALADPSDIQWQGHRSAIPPQSQGQTALQGRGEHWAGNSSGWQSWGLSWNSASHTRYAAVKGHCPKSLSWNLGSFSRCLEKAQFKILFLGEGIKPRNTHTHTKKYPHRHKHYGYYRRERGWGGRRR